MSRRKIEEIISKDKERKAKVYRNSEWDEYQVVFYNKGMKLNGANYYSGDQEDAVDTAKHWVESPYHRGND